MSCLTVRQFEMLERLQAEEWAMLNMERNGWIWADGSCVHGTVAMGLLIMAWVRIDSNRHLVISRIGRNVLQIGGRPVARPHTLYANRVFTLLLFCGMITSNSPHGKSQSVGVPPVAQEITVEANGHGQLCSIGDCKNPASYTLGATIRVKLGFISGQHAINAPVCSGCKAQLQVALQNA